MALRARRQPNQDGCTGVSLPLRDITPLAGQLEHTLSTGLLPPDVTGWGSQLLQRLRQPVRVAVTGAPGTGKSALIDMPAISTAARSAPCPKSAAPSASASRSAAPPRDTPYSSQPGRPRS